MFYLTGLGFSEAQTGTLFTLTLIGDTAISLYLTTRADRFGRRRMLILGAVLMAAAGAAFAYTSNFLFLIIAGTVGVISPTGNEVGPFLSIEQAALSQIVPDDTRTEVFAWYTLAGSLATATGALCSGVITEALQARAVATVDSYRTIVIIYAAIGLLLAGFFSRLSGAAEIVPGPEQTAWSTVRKTFLGIGGDSRKVILKLSACPGFILRRIHRTKLRRLLVLSALRHRSKNSRDDFLLGQCVRRVVGAARLEACLTLRVDQNYGFHPSSFERAPDSCSLMPNLPLAAALLLLRFSISQMDVPTRQSYTMAVVRPEERSAAAGITTVARTTGAAVAPFIAGLMFARPSLINVPFFVAGSLKIVYDLLLYREFKGVQPPEERNSNFKQFRR